MINSINDDSYIFVIDKDTKDNFIKNEHCICLTLPCNNYGCKCKICHNDKY